MSKRQQTAVLSQTPTGQAAIFHKCTTTSPDLAQSFQNQRNVTINQVLYGSRKSVFTEMNSEKTCPHQVERVAVTQSCHYYNAPHKQDKQNVSPGHLMGVFMVKKRIEY